MKAKGTTITTTTTTTTTFPGEMPRSGMEEVKPRGKGNLDMVIAFDTTGSMASYIDDVRRQVSSMIPELFRDNPDLRLGIVAFGDYCDMRSKDDFGDAYQWINLTDRENDLVRFVNTASDTAGGDGDEFYELVLKRIIDEMAWREDSHKTILLIADANPHPLGYSYGNFVENNQIDWRHEAQRAAERAIRIDTVSIHGLPWYRVLSEMTNGICVPFRSSGNTGNLVHHAASARSAMAFAERGHMDKFHSLRCKMDKQASLFDAEMHACSLRYSEDLDSFLKDDEKKTE